MVTEVIEELVGEIVSEHDEELPNLSREPTGTHLIQGTSALRDIDRELGLSLDQLDDATTIGGLCVSLSGGRVPRPAERISVGDQAEIEIVESSPRRVRLIRLRKRDSTP